MTVAPYDLDWWLPHVRGICDHFVRASQGDIDVRHWQDIYKRHDAYGWDIVNGWLVKLIPYLKNWKTGNFTARNPLLDKPDEEVSTNELPGGVSQVPFRCRWSGESEDAAMEFLGGFVGVTQDAVTLALRPKLGWAVRQGSDLDRLFARLSKHKPAPPLDSPEFDARIAGLMPERPCELPGDFLSFYKHCNGVGLFGDAFRIRPLEAIELVEGMTGQATPGYEDEVVILNAGPWVRFCDLADGTFLAIELRHTYKEGWKVVRTTAGASPPDCPVVAWSFRAFLDNALGSGGTLDVLRPVS
jgi:hypothetical protein